MWIISKTKPEHSRRAQTSYPEIDEQKSSHACSVPIPQRRLQRGRRNSSSRLLRCRPGTGVSHHTAVNSMLTYSNTKSTEEIAKKSEWWWPEGKPQLRTHRGHTETLSRACAWAAQVGQNLHNSPVRARIGFLAGYGLRSCEDSIAGRRSRAYGSGDVAAGAGSSLACSSWRREGFPLQAELAPGICWRGNQKLMNSGKYHSSVSSLSSHVHSHVAVPLEAQTLFYLWDSTKWVLLLFIILYYP